MSLLATLQTFSGNREDKASDSQWKTILQDTTSQERGSPQNCIQGDCSQLLAVFYPTSNSIYMPPGKALLSDDGMIYTVTLVDRDL